LLDQITPLILTLDEAPNIGRVLDRLAWAREVIVVDSFSSDGTAEIVQRYANARLVRRRFDSHAGQWNFGLTETGIRTAWVLALDADYLVPEALTRELAALAPAPDIDGYRASFRYCIGGRPLRGAVYPPVTVLFRRARAEYVQDGHTQRLRLPGKILELANPLVHDDRKSLRRWFRSQQRYMRLESAKLARRGFRELRPQDRVRKLIVIAPVAMLFYCLFVKRNVLDGRAGLAYALQRAVAEGLLSLHLIRALLSRGRDG
jgi:glycosyltransferase involved in cell wall biosynthesis